MGVCIGLTLLLVPTAAQGMFAQMGVDAARTGDSQTPGPEWGDLAFTVRLPANGTTWSPPLIVNGYAFVAGTVIPGQETTGFNGIYRIHLATAAVSPLIPIPLLPARTDPVGDQVHGIPKHQTAMATDGERLLVTHTIGVEAFPIGGGEQLWQWRPEGLWGQYDHLICAAPALREGLLYVACEWHAANPLTPDYGDEQHRLFIEAIDVATGQSRMRWDAGTTQAASLRLDANATMAKTSIGPLSVIGDLVVVVLSDYVDGAGPYQSRLVAIDVTTGKQRWTVSQGQDVQTCAKENWPGAAQWVFGDPASPRFAKAVFPFTSAPTGAQGKVYHDQCVLNAIDANTQETVSTPLASTNPDMDVGAGLALVGSRLYATSSDIMYVVDTVAGTRPQEFHTLGPEPESWGRAGFIVDGTTLYALVDRWTATGNAGDIEGTSLVALDILTGAELWRHEVAPGVPTDPHYWPGGYQAFAVADGVAVMVGRDGTVSVLGHTSASIGALARTENLYPRLAEEVSVDLSESTAGLFGPPTEYRATWGDGQTTEWQASPTFQHAYDQSRVMTARFFARNEAGQVGSTPITFQVGGVPPVAASPIDGMPAGTDSPETATTWLTPVGGVFGGSLLLFLLAVIAFLAWAWMTARRGDNATTKGERYKVEKEIGRGSHARTFLARDVILDRKVVLKQATAPWLLEDERRRRFLKEARVLARLNHPNVVTIHEILADATAPTIVMEFMEGGSLQDLLKRKPRLPVDEAVRISLDLLAGLQHIHEANVVHRDIKPANILLSRNGTAKVSDLGVARPPQDLATATMAAGGSQPGSPLYMSPEQARGDPVDRRSDVYSAGAVMYELFTGWRHVTTKQEPEFRVRQRIVEGDFEFAGMEELGPVGSILRRTLAFDAKKRFPTANALHQALADVVGHGKGLRPRPKATLPGSRRTTV